jgi:hypothetical protein
MKMYQTLIITAIASSLVSITALSQNPASKDSTGLPGDNFSLQGALSLFKQAASPEDFENKINDPNSNVNNLDLNADGEVDYIRVVSKQENDIHLLVLQAPVSADENQDIAVIEIEKNGEASAVLQIIGDEDIFGEAVIVEPEGGENDNAYLEQLFLTGATAGPSANSSLLTPSAIIVNVWGWPSVRFMYAPGYRPWISPWRWRQYPARWRPWRPFPFAVWQPRRAPYFRQPFVVVTTHRVVRAHRVYTPIRITSVTVRNRHAVAVNNYRVSRSRTTITGPRGNKVTKTTTKVISPRRNIRAKKTTVRRRRG